MTMAVIYPILLGLDRLENASLLRSDSTFHYLTGLPSYPDPQSLRRFLLHAPPEFREQLHRFNDRLLQHFIHWPEHRSRLILDLDSTVVTAFGQQEGAEVGYNPRYRGKRSYDPLLCLEANSSFVWDTELRPGNAGTWAGSTGLLACCTPMSEKPLSSTRMTTMLGRGAAAAEGCPGTRSVAIMANRIAALIADALVRVANTVEANRLFICCPFIIRRRFGADSRSSECSG